MLGALRFLWKRSAEDIAAAVLEEHGPGALTEAEEGALAGATILVWKA